MTSRKRSKLSLTSREEKRFPTTTESGKRRERMGMLSRPFVARRATLLSYGDCNLIYVSLIQAVLYQDRSQKA